MEETEESIAEAVLGGDDTDEDEGTSDPDDDTDEAEPEDEEAAPEDEEAEPEGDETTDVTAEFKKAQEGDLTVKRHKDGSYSIWEGDDEPEKEGLKTKAAVLAELKKMVK